MRPVRRVRVVLTNFRKCLLQTYTHARYLKQTRPFVVQVICHWERNDAAGGIYELCHEIYIRIYCMRSQMDLFRHFYHWLITRARALWHGYKSFH